MVLTGKSLWRELQGKKARRLNPDYQPPSKIPSCSSGTAPAKKNQFLESCQTGLFFLCCDCDKYRAPSSRLFNNQERRSFQAASPAVLANRPTPHILLPSCTLHFCTSSFTSHESIILLFLLQQYSTPLPSPPAFQCRPCQRAGLAPTRIPPTSASLLRLLLHRHPTRTVDLAHRRPTNEAIETRTVAPVGEPPSWRR